MRKKNLKEQLTVGLIATALIGAGALTGFVMHSIPAKKKREVEEDLPDWVEDKISKRVEEKVDLILDETIPGGVSYEWEISSTTQE